jgi:hypothetical protein
MAFDNNLVIKLLPIYDASNNIPYNFTSDTITIKKSIKEGPYEFDHTGTYKIRSSSCLFLKTDASNYAHYGPFVAFNNENTKNKKDFFICDMPYQDSKQNSNYAKYTQFPYAFGLNTPGSYIGGGSQSNTFSTIVNKSNIKGEWLQIKLPNGNSDVSGKGGMYLTKYRISIPKNVGNMPISFPKKFIVVGSNEGLDTSNWNLIDEQNLVTEPDISSQPIEFKVVTSSKYIYFRLIVLELFKNYAGVIGIKQWILYGKPYPSIEKFECIDNAYKYHEFKKNPEFSNFNLSIPVENIKYKQDFHGLHKSISHDVYVGTTICVLAISIWIYSLFGK